MTRELGHTIRTRADPGFEVRGGANWKILKPGGGGGGGGFLSIFLLAKPFSYAVLPWCPVTKLNT